MLSEVSLPTTLEDVYLEHHPKADGVQGGCDV